VNKEIVLKEWEKLTFIESLLKTKTEIQELLQKLEKEGDPEKLQHVASLRTFLTNLENYISPQANDRQGELFPEEIFPLFVPSKNVELKKEFALNFGGLEKIEENYKHLLGEKLHSGLTLQQHIDKVRDWYNSLHGEHLGNWIKLFAYAKAVKNYADSGQDITNFRQIGESRFCFSIKQDAKFFEYFIRRDRKSGQFTTKAKEKFLKWLYDNQHTIEFPRIDTNGNLWNVPTRVYEYAENVSEKEILFIIDTSILESAFKDYVSIDISEIDLINDLWDGIADQDDTFREYRLNGFIDTPLKFLLTLKQIYSREGGNFATQSGYYGNTQKLTQESLNNHMGNLSERIKRHLQSRGKAGLKKSNVSNNITKLLLNTIWKIAIERKWLMSEPKNEKGTWTFNINPAYFDKKETAKRLKKP
jgi:hypothetical protein